MFDVDGYLRRIGCPGATGVDLETLRLLQKRHLMAIPYSSLAYDLADGVAVVDLDEDEVFDRSIADGRGGACYHLNRLFYRLLSELGYRTTLLAGSTAEGRAAFGSDVEHMFVRVALDGADWLVDVGYPGPTYVEPLRVGGPVQTQYGSQFRLVDQESGTALQRRGWPPGGTPSTRSPGNPGSGATGRRWRATSGRSWPIRGGTTPGRCCAAGPWTTARCSCGSAGT